MKGSYSVVKIDPTDLGQEKFETQPNYQNILLEDAMKSAWELQSFCQVANRIFVVVDEQGRPILEHVTYIHEMRDHLVEKILRQVKHLQEITYETPKKGVSGITRFFWGKTKIYHPISSIPPYSIATRYR